MSKVDDFLAAATFAGAYTFDVEHNPNLGPHLPDFKLTGCGFSSGSITFFCRDMDEIKHICTKLFPDPELDAVAFNAKYDLKCLKAAGLMNDYPESVVDPMIAGNLLNDNKRPNELSLKVMVWDQFGYEMMSFDEAWLAGPDSDTFKRYACDDAKWEWELWDALKPKLEKQGLMKLFRKVLMPACKVFADMELSGIKWNLEGVRRLLTGFQTLRDDMEGAIFGEIGSLNLNSGDQVARRLFGDLGYPTTGLPLTKSGKRVAVDSRAMDMLAKRHPVCRKIRTFRTACKMIGTYLEPLTHMAMGSVDGRIHPTFWLVSATGRTRSEKPNFQNIPAFLADDFKHLSIRNNIIAEKGRKLCVCDLSQIELRVIAHTTKDPTFLKAYLDWQCTACGEVGSSETLLHECPKCGADEDEDVITVCPTCGAKHVRTVKAVKKGAPKVCSLCAKRVSYDDAKVRAFWHGLDLHQITTDSIAALGGNRQNGKTSNFALVYGASAPRMYYEYPSLSLRRWEQVIDEYMDTYKGVRNWHVRMRRQMHETGVVTDIFGRKRRIPKIIVRENEKHALNMIVNFGPQSSACAMIELAMVNMREHFIEQGTWMNRVWLTNMVHDEIILEVENEFIDEVIPVIQDKMEHAVQLRVPVRTSICVVDKWGQAK